MISSETPYKLAEIIRDTWPWIYRPHKDWKPPSKVDNKKINDIIRGVCTPLF